MTIVSTVLGICACFLGFAAVLIAHWFGDDRSYVAGHGPLGFAIGVGLMCVALILANAVVL